MDSYFSLRKFACKFHQETGTRFFDLLGATFDRKLCRAIYSEGTQQIEKDVSKDFIPLPLKKRLEHKI